MLITLKARHEVTKNPFQTWEDGLMFLLVLSFQQVAFLS